MIETEDKSDKVVQTDKKCYNRGRAQTYQMGNHS